MSIVNLANGDTIWSLAWFVTTCVWLIITRVNYNYDRIELLEKKVEKYDAVCELVEELRKSSELDREQIELMDAKIRHIAKYIYFSKEPIND
jgi:uncharacterized protein (UPF0305 family)